MGLRGWERWASLWEKVRESSEAHQGASEMSPFFFFNFREREGKGEKERGNKEEERETLICCFMYLCVHWLLLLCALTRD